LSAAIAAASDSVGLMNSSIRWACLLLLLAAPALPQSPAPALAQTSADAYTRYELLAPASASFRIVYDVTATAAGAQYYFNPIRQGSEPTVHGVTDLATGQALAWELVSSEAAAAAGLADAGEGGLYLQVTLARPVPEEGEGRIRIDKTYKDAASYHGAGGALVFERTLGVRRNAVVLPPGFELTACNYPSQVATEEDGRIRISFMNPGPEGVPLRLTARALPPKSARPAADDSAQVAQRAPAMESVATSARTDFEVTQRAFENREIVYFLQQPETHSFRLYHDYTESRPGSDRYLNVVRPGSRASAPAARVLDTGEELTVETLRGAAISERGIDIGEEVTAETELVAIWFAPVAAGASTRLRITETYTDPGRYGLDGEELLWDRSFGRSRNTVVLPAGWYLTASSVPAVIDETAEGEIRLYFENDRPGEIEVFLRAGRR
jgi:hypothetical protein